MNTGETKALTKAEQLDLLKEIRERAARNARSAALHPTLNNPAFKGEQWSRSTQSARAGR